SYYTNEILFDNVLTGDYATIDLGTPQYARGGPLVHIRATPEGGPAGTSPPNPATSLPHTFYDRYIEGRTIDRIAVAPHLDRRQPLPSTFAAPWLDNGTVFTLLTIWREGHSETP